MRNDDLSKNLRRAALANDARLADAFWSAHLDDIEERRAALRRRRKDGKK